MTKKPRPSDSALRAVIANHGITRAARILRIDPRTLRRWGVEAGAYAVRPYRWRRLRLPWWRRWLPWRLGGAR